MIESVTAVAVALGTVMATKALEKTGEKVGELVWDKSTQFITTLKKTAPTTATALELAPEQPLDYGQAVLEIEAVAKDNEELTHSINELAKAAEAEPHPKITEILQKIYQELQQKQSSIQNLAKLAEKINNLNQAQVINITQNNTF